MPFEIVRNDIANMQVDAVVNAANYRPMIGAGVDSWLHKKAGVELLEARKQIGEIPFGDVAITPAFNLNARYVLHASSPVWVDGYSGEAQLLTQCYEKALYLALEYQCESIAFPLLSTGNHGFPKDQALQIAIGVFSKFLLQHDMDIYLVVFDHRAVALSEKLFNSVQSYIDEHYVQEVEFEQYGYPRPTLLLEDRHSAEHCLTEYSLRNELMPCELPSDYAVSSVKAIRSLDDLMNELEETFSESLIRLIDQKGLKDPDVYKKANVDRKLFSKIKNNKDYQPSKSTAIAFAIALELNLDKTLDLIGRAGYTLSSSNKTDVIVQYCIEHQIYDMYQVNTMLFTFEQPCIGA